ncbi:hypothetical protein JIG36_11320 [Actinoplanes sp. LDG1-06]|uniref:Uncharacterized protein n=1 Tax=Paractinoplanes ovalisporus TaxID=2810368 RepID=A0ABS2AA62_9ACTN|nr:hypothetical protein [Actinoplanes ovalisporus]MBM2616146.1 hypothetical protein [Actinoplanes ovalisporus]
MTDHHDFGDHDDFSVFDTPDLHDTPDSHDSFGHFDQPDDHELFDDPGHFEPVEHHHEEPLDDPLPVEDHAAVADDVVTADPVDVFPPALDVGELPEPVDGFPWIDTGSLGVVHAAAVADTPDPVRPEELAEYAGVDLPPAQDPWAALADSDDPATSALARWWQEN